MVGSNGGDHVAGHVLTTRSTAREGLDPSRVNRVRPAYQQVADQLRDRILDGSLGSGDRLPTELDLADIFGVSRSTVREALRVLASRDLIYTTRGTTGGTFVSRVQFEKVSEYLETSLGLMSGTDDVTLGDLLEARELLEVPAAGLAALRHEEHHLEEMKQVVEREKQTRGRGMKFREHRNFHGIVVNAAGNGLIGVMTEPVFRVLQARLARGEMDAGFWREVDDDHLEILDRIRDRDSDGASAAMKDHLAKLSIAYRDTPLV
ncbi:FadR/GntR family transcriptional regulator [Aeromicrobium wangtongii]|uniref:FadR/GntR family transcriptional regulator n=1 Tax=Aeromicrobium wangtongii TaxID=2969247 RepID=UPI0020176F96|nr:FCD domain-containing protein [Aeromicrobium wangtongii]MCL3819612.1 FCD domain-containing protein [Aeromicrobium wangtongii]